MTINASQNIMIDPNEPLILPDRTTLTGRIEWFLYSLCLLDYENLPTPMSRIEEFANALVTGEVPNIEPQSRVEEYFLAILTGDVENLPEPESRVEVLLNKLARGEFDLSDVEPIQSRYELLIAYLIKNGGMNDVTYVLHEFLASETPYTMYNTQEKPTKSAILKGSTKYKDIETGEILEEFDAERNLELVSVKMPVLTTSNEDGTKTNILSTPEDLVLRGIGEARDELNLLTGEKISKLEQLTVTNNTNWLTQTSSHSDCYSFYYNPQIGKSDGLLICDNLPSINSLSIGEGCRITGTGRININILKSKLNDSSLNSLNDYLAINPLTFIYELPNASIKTVDLSDNHVYSYKDTTHYACSSEEGSLVPTLSIDVPTNLPAVVTRQRVTIQELEKENVALKNEIEETANSSVNGDLELMSSQFELDFRLFEIEMNLDMPMMAMMRGVKSMAMTVYQQAKTLILAGKYEREGMEYKLNRYKEAGRITVEEYEELIALMDARELVD